MRDNAILFAPDPFHHFTLYHYGKPDDDRPFDTLGRTVWKITEQSLGTEADADRVLVFDQGRIAEMGSYAELVAHGGVFTELIRSSQQPALDLDNRQESPPEAEPAPLAQSA